MWRLQQDEARVEAERREVEPVAAEGPEPAPTALLAAGEAVRPSAD
jgi:hypothetical protein